MTNIDFGLLVDLVEGEGFVSLADELFLCPPERRAEVALRAAEAIEEDGYRDGSAASVVADLRAFAESA